MCSLTHFGYNQDGDRSEKMKYSIGVDLGGTTVKIGLFSPDGKLLDKAVIPTRTDLGKETVFSEIAAEIRQILSKNGAELSDCSIGMGVAGPVDESGYVEGMVDLNMYDLYPGKELSGLLNGIPVKVSNDANVAALGEMWQGGGRGYENLVLITLGTGVGSGIVIHGKIVNGAHGLAGEIGHLWVNPDEPEVCNCGGHGCLDQMASAGGIVRNAGRFLAKSDAPSVLRGIGPLTAKDVFDAAKEGDKIAEDALNYCMSFLGKMSAVINYVIDPDVIVFGGGISHAGDYLLNMVFRHYQQYPKLKKEYTKFALARLGGEAGIYGAAYLGMTGPDGQSGVEQ